MFATVTAVMSPPTGRLVAWVVIRTSSPEVWAGAGVVWRPKRPTTVATTTTRDNLERDSLGTDNLETTFLARFMRRNSTGEEPTLGRVR